MEKSCFGRTRFPGDVFISPGVRPGSSIAGDESKTLVPMLQALSRWRTSILVLSALLIAGLFASRHLVGPLSGGHASVGPVSDQEADEHVGERAEVCGRVVDVTWARDIGGRPTFINLGGEHPEQSFTAVIWEDDRPGWRVAPEDQYLDRTICVTGKIQVHEDTPQIVVSSPGQIREQ